MNTRIFFSTIITFIIIGSINPSYIYAATPTISQEKTSTPSALPSQATSEGIIERSVQLLKDKIATKVAELNKTTQKITTGYVDNITQNSFTISTKDQKNTLNVTIDESLTKLYSLREKTQKEIALKEIKKNDFVLVEGPQIEDTVTANSIYLSQRSVVKFGRIIEVKKEEYTIKLETDEKDVYTLDIESFTRQLMLDDKKGTIVRTGFANLKEGDNAYFSFTLSGKDMPTRASTVTLLIIPHTIFQK